MILAHIGSIDGYFFAFFGLAGERRKEREKQKEKPTAFATNTSSSFYTDTPLRRLQDALHGLFLPRLHRVLLLLSASYSIVNYFSSFTSHPVHIHPLIFCYSHISQYSHTNIEQRGKK